MSKLVTTPWDDEKYNNDNYKANGLIKSNVDSQDDITDKITGSSINATITSIAQNSPIAKLGKNIANTINSTVKNVTGKTLIENKKNVNLSNGTDYLGKELVKEKEETYKYIPITSKLGLYSNYKNFLGIAGGLFVGALGHTTSTNFIDGAVKSFGISTGINIPGVIDKVKNSGSINLNPDELFELSSANFYTLLTSKPGAKIKQTTDTLEYITGTHTTSKPYTNKQLEDFKNNYRYYNEESENTGAELANHTLTTKINGNDNSNRFNGIKKEVAISTGDYTTLDINNYAPSRKLNAQIYNRENNYFREIGGLYVEPYYSNGELTCFEIPFEFNPQISGGDMSADYDSPDIIGRILPIQNYSKSNTGTITLTTEYLANSKGSTSAETEEISNDQWLNGWMRDWDLEKIRITEAQYRSLTLPYIDGAKFVQPPIVRIKFRTLDEEHYKETIPDKFLATKNNNYDDGGSTGKNTYDIKANPEQSTVGDLFKYPIGENSGKLQMTKVFDGFTREKRYVVKSVSISPIENSYGNSYYFDVGDFSNFTGVAEGLRRGFKVSVTMQETTKNFLDLIPNAYDYLSNISMSETTRQSKAQDGNNNNKTDEYYDKIRTAILQYKTNLSLVVNAGKYDFNNPIKIDNIEDDNEKLFTATDDKNNIFVRFFNFGENETKRLIK